MADIPTWAKNKMKYDQKYDRENKVQIAIKLNKNTDPELIEIYRLIPNKAQWFKECLRRYARENPDIFSNKSDPEEWPE